MFLDEPTTGLDPRSRNQVWDIVRALVAGGRPSCCARSTSTRPTSSPTGSRSSTTAASSPRGRPAQLKASVGQGALHVRLLDPAQRDEAERVLARALDAPRSTLEPDPARCRSPIADADRAAEAVAELARAGSRSPTSRSASPTLDEVFLALTGHPAEDDEEEEAA